MTSNECTECGGKLKEMAEDGPTVYLECVSCGKQHIRFPAGDLDDD